MKKQPIKLTIKKDDDEISIYEEAKCIEKMNINESVDFRGAIERLLEDNFENEFLLEKSEGDFDTVEQDAADFLSKIIGIYNEKVREWGIFKAETEQSTDSEANQ